MMRCAAPLLATLAILPAAGCSGDGVEYEGRTGQPIPASLDAWVPSIDVTVDGAAGAFLIDTGAPFTMVDVNSYPDLSQGLQRLDVGAFDLTFPSLQVAAFDVFPGTTAGTALDGIIGGDVLREFTLSVDYQGARVWVDDAWDGSLPIGADASAVGAYRHVEALVDGGGSFTVPGECDGGCGGVSLPATRMVINAYAEGDDFPLVLLVDTGASAVVLEEAVLDRLAPSARPRLDGVTVGTANGNVTAYFTRVSSLRLDDAVAEQSVPVLVLPDESLFDGLEAEVGFEIDGLIGGSFLRHYLTSIDYGNETLSLARYASTTHIDPNEYVRVGFTMAKAAGVWQVRDVYPGTDAAGQGLRSGETIAELDGTSIASLDEAQVAAILGRFAEGQAVPVGVSRAGSVTTLNILVQDLLPAFTESS